MNTKWMWLALLALVCATPAFAGDKSWQQSDIELCRMSRNVVHAFWQRHLYDAPPAVSAMMVAAMDGHAAEVQKALAAWPAADMPRWRQLALSMALLGGQSGTAETLLQAGADANVAALTPRFTSRSYRHLKQGMAHDKHFGGAKGVHAMEKTSLMDNREHHGPAPLFTAIKCDDLTATRMLLQHDAKPMRPVRPHKRQGRQGIDPFMFSVMHGNPAILRLMLAHGAQPCIENQRFAANWALRSDHRRDKPLTIVELARKYKVPEPLQARLVCHDP